MTLSRLRVLLLGPASLLMLLTLVVPLGFMLRDSLNRFDPSEMMIAAITPENYLRFVVDPFYRGVMYTTIRVSIIVTAACLAANGHDVWGVDPDSTKVEMISQGASLLNLSVVVAQDDLREAVRQLHSEFFSELDPGVFD